MDEGILYCCDIFLFLGNKFEHCVINLGGDFMTKKKNNVCAETPPHRLRTTGLAYTRFVFFGRKNQHTSESSSMSAPTGTERGGFGVAASSASHGGKKNKTKECRESSACLLSNVMNAGYEFPVCVCV